MGWQSHANRSRWKLVAALTDLRASHQSKRCQKNERADSYQDRSLFHLPSPLFLYPSDLSLEKLCPSRINSVALEFAEYASMRKT